jgi:hypothetical protein
VVKGVVRGMVRGIVRGVVWRARHLIFRCGVAKVGILADKRVWARA